MKKLISIIAVLVMVISLMPTGASAARVGDVVGYAQPTDIIATINGYQLQSYNVNGYTYICVEDLIYYGFDVSYDNNTRTLSVKRNYGITWINPQGTNPNFWDIGELKSRKSILYTDINTYVNDQWVGSSNINGRTIISFNELGRFGTVEYNNDRREISLFMDDVNYNEVAAAAMMLQYSIEKPEGISFIIRAKGDVLMFIFKSDMYISSYEINSQSIGAFKAETEPVYRDVLYNLKNSGVPVSSIYCELKNSNGAYITSFQVY